MLSDEGKCAKMCNKKTNYTIKEHFWQDRKFELLYYNSISKNDHYNEKVTQFAVH